MTEELAPGHSFDGVWRCTCGWQAPLGTSTWREFDKHILEVRKNAE